MALTRALTPLQQNGLTLDALKTHTTSLKAAGDRLVAARAWPDMSEDVPDVKKIVERAVRDLSTITKPKDVSKAPRIVAPLIGLGTICSARQSWRWPTRHTWVTRASCLAPGPTCRIATTSD